MSEVESGAARSAANAPDDFDLRGIGYALWRKKWWVIVPTLLVALLASIAVNMVTPRYRSEARILIEARDNIFLRPEAERTGDRSNIDQEAVTSQVQVVLSRELARRVIRQLKLTERPEFDPVLRGVSPVRHLMAMTGLAKDPLKMTPEERVFEAYYDRISAYPVERSRVIVVEFQSFDPDLAARAANAVAEAYLGVQQEARQDQTRAASQWLAAETESLRKKVAEAEARVTEYRSKSNLFVGSNNTPLSNQQLTELNSQLALAKSQKAEAEAKARLARSLLRSGRSAEASDIVNSELIRRLAEQEATLRAQLAEQSSTLLERHPRIRELKAQIADLDRRIRSEAEKIVRSFENDSRLASDRVESLTASLDQLKNQAASSGERDVQLRAFEREAKAQRDLLESYLAKLREANARDSLNVVPADARVISRPVVSNTPYFPKKLPTILIAALSTFALCVGCVVSGHLLSDAPYRPAMAVRPVAASLRVPAEELEPDRLEDARGEFAPPPMTAFEADASRLAEAVAATVPPPMRNATDDLASSMMAAGDAARRIVVIGADREVGTTSTAIALGRALAEEGKVIVIDLALSAPAVAAISREPDAAGIADLVRGTASFRHVIARDRYSRLHLIGAGKVGAEAGRVLSSERLTIALNALERTYDHVIIDAGQVNDAALERVAEFAPQAVLVTAGVSAETAEDARHRLAAAGMNNVTIFAEKAPHPDEIPSGAGTAAA